MSPGSNGSLTFAMYGGNWLNTGYLPTGVTNFVNNNGTNNSAQVIDRFWRIEPTNYSTKPALSNLIFTYRDPEWSVASNSIIESNLIAQRYNSTLNDWDDFMPGTVTTPLLIYLLSRRYRQLNYLLGGLWLIIARHCQLSWLILMQNAMEIK